VCTCDDLHPCLGGAPCIDPTPRVLELGLMPDPAIVLPKLCGDPLAGVGGPPAK
jgi:hypothetical protein